MSRPERQPTASPARRTDCRSCRHHFVTWDTGRPHGCNAYGFKSPVLPSLLVLRISGVKCQLHERRPPGRKAGPRRR